MDRGCRYAKHRETSGDRTKGRCTTEGCQVRAKPIALAPTGHRGNRAPLSNTCRGPSRSSGTPPGCNHLLCDSNRRSALALRPPATFWSTLRVAWEMPEPEGFTESSRRLSIASLRSTPRLCSGKPSACADWRDEAELSPQWTRRCHRVWISAPLAARH